MMRTEQEAREALTRLEERTKKTLIVPTFTDEMKAFELARLWFGRGMYDRVVKFSDMIVEE